MITAGALAAGVPAFAARTDAPPKARSHIPELRHRLDLSVLPRAGRQSLEPIPHGKELFGVFCNSASDCWAVGEIKNKDNTVNQVLHWTGKKWFSVKVPNQAGTAKGDFSELFAVRCTSAKNCWAVGDSQRSGNVAQLDQALHFDGTKWTVAATPAPGGTAGGAFNTLDDVACTSAKDCWAVGEYGLVGNGSQMEVGFNQVLHFDGRHWMFMKSPDPAGTSMGDVNALDGVRCTGPTACWAGGSDGTVAPTPNFRNEILFSNGKKWTVVKGVPNPAGTGKLHLNFINTLACTAKDDCWAVGLTGNLNGNNNKQFEHNEALHWNGKHWATVKTPNPGGKQDELFGVTCAAAQDCWAVGTEGFQPGLNEALHWNGAKWSVVHTVNGGGTGKDVSNALNSVRCASRSNCWAVGDSESAGAIFANQILHWNGSKWSDS
ncbi:MAG TPA: hypothetical protein VFI65_30715 [Streptosporangiaceae bacterium]|nr:hypothetical protein [Streptosporangiaceae bacterium]